MVVKERIAHLSQVGANSIRVFFELAIKLTYNITDVLKFCGALIYLKYTNRK